LSRTSSTIQRGAGSMVSTPYRSAFAGVHLPPASQPVTIKDCGPAARFIFWGNGAVLDTVFGIPLPSKPCRSECSGSRAALWLGPGETLLLAPESEGATIFHALKEAAGSGGSLADVSHRQAGLFIEGPKAAYALNAACPLSLADADFPAGMCTRTVFAKAEIVLWRPAAHLFRIEVARSFAPYAAGLLTEIMRDIT
jgi:sarcosine oxidase, subunit gamma